MAGKRRRLTADEEAFLAAGEKLREKAYTVTMAYPIRLLKAATKVAEAERDPARILEAVLIGPDAVARESLLHHSKPLFGTMTVLPWDRKRPGRPRGRGADALVEYEALRKAGNPAKVAKLEVAKRHRPELAAANDEHARETWFRNLREARRRARRRAATK